MSVISGSLSSISTLQPLHETAREFHSGCTEFEQALDTLFCDVDQLRLELADRMQAVEQERNQLCLREAELSKRQQQGSRDEVQHLKEGLESRDLQLAKALDELARTRQQLEQTRDQLRQADEAERYDQNEIADTAALAAWAREREALEAELELVRTHAAELNETVTQQQHEIDTQKTELGTELQQLRKLVEKHVDLTADRAVSSGWETAQAPSLPAAVLTQSRDPVVNSVMAQFAKLQKDVAQRRRCKQ